MSSPGSSRAACRPAGPRSPACPAGGLAFARLTLVELLTARAFGQTPAQLLTAMITPPGALGLLGQIGFALIALIHQPRG